jgi:hypothetical protein
LEWLFHDEIADTELTPSHHEAPHAASTFQRLPRTLTNRLFHPCAGITWGFDEEAYCPKTDALPEQFVQSNATHDDLTTAGSWGYARSEETPDLF